MALERAGVEPQGAGAANRVSLGAVFYPLYRRVFDDGDRFVTALESKLGEARMADPVEMYLSRALGVGVLVGLALWLLGAALGYAVFATGAVSVGVVLGVPVSHPGLLWLVETAKVPVLVAGTGTVFGSAGFVGGFGALVALPYVRADAREREIDLLLSDAVSYMYALSVGGLNQVEILRAMAQAGDTYGEVTREFGTIVQETEYFDTDYRTAIRRQAARTPSDELAQFLTDMLSIINSGGDLQQFLDDKKDAHMRTAKQQQEDILETLELFGEMYLTLSLFPLLLVVVLVIMNILGNAPQFLLFLTVYGLVPTVGAAFLVLVAAFKYDDPGGSHIPLDEATRDPPVTTPDDGARAGDDRVFERIRRRELRHEVRGFLRQPHVFFREQPRATLALTVPLATTLLAWALLSGAAPTTWAGLVAAPVRGTFLLAYVPAYAMGVPYAAFRFWNVRSRRAVLGTLTDDLRKLSSANDTGLTLLGSIRLVGETSASRLAAEFEEMHAKVTYGMRLREALVAFNNEYRVPRLARTVRLISEAQETANHITAVLRTAAQASENQDDIERERRSRTRMQVVVVVMTYLTLLAVMAVLKLQFLDTMAGLAAQSSGTATGGLEFGSVDVNLLSLLFFHAVTAQAVLSGLVSGYLREGALAAGVKYVLALMTVALIVWTGVG